MYPTFLNPSVINQFSPTSGTFSHIAMDTPLEVFQVLIN